ncbi:unnamed protein product [Polarella glacialis]|uniref:Uncharacterized protein n=1 Tax=Polarella glacialis TaxID=89957 RepID=A0A813E7E3_POLGL|nr:unnamed protein product [Polarella glacialis]
MASDPNKEAAIQRAQLEKELMQWKSPANLMKSLAGPTGAMQDGGPFYRMPTEGDTVTVSGMRRRPELNGAVGQILSTKPDEFGRVTVRVYDSVAGDTRKMKIQPFRLVPSSSNPQLLMSEMQDDRSSVRSMSRQGSVVSGRALGSAISASAMSALSNTGSAAVQRRGTPAASQLLKVRSSPAL